MNPATKSLAGLDSSRAGVSYCCSVPPRPKTATASPSFTASSISWVTKTMVFCKFALQPQHLGLQFLADHRVDGGERLVHQQDRRVRGQRPGHADALLLPTGELGRVALPELGVQPHPLQHLVGRADGRPAGTAP